MRGHAQAAALLGGLVGPAVGGLLADTAGLRAPFTLTGCAALAAALYGAVRLPETVGLRSRGGVQDEGAQQEDVCWPCLSPPDPLLLVMSHMPMLHIRRLGQNTGGRGMLR
jgi:MFS family permease